MEEFWYNFTSDYDSTRHAERNHRFLSININGKFVDYIGEVGQSDSMYYYLHDQIRAMGDISTGLVVQNLADGSDIDYHLIKNRLLAMVCIFSMAERLDSSGSTVRKKNGSAVRNRPVVLYGIKRWRCPESTDFAEKNG